MNKKERKAEDLSLDPSLTEFSYERLQAEVKRRQRLVNIKATFEREEKTMLAEINRVEEYIKQLQGQVEGYYRKLSDLRRAAEQKTREADQILLSVGKKPKSTEENIC